MRAIVEWVVAYLFRWLPHAAPTGLFRIGAPDENSPVIVTANFSLTVHRVRKAVAGENLWLLVANSGGINVWCAADGGLFTHQRVIDAIKVAGLAERVRHRLVILPALSASGIDLAPILRETGFHARFGPVYAKDIPAYLAAHGRKTDAMRRFNFGAAHRLDMFLPMNFPTYLLLAVPVGIFNRHSLPGFTLLFWGAVAFLYVFVDHIPGSTGWAQALLAATGAVAAWGAADWLTLGNPLAHWAWFVGMFGIFFAAGFDLAGTISPRRSDAELLMHRLGFTRFGSVFVLKTLGLITLDRDACNGCRACWEICPVGVYDSLDEDKKITFAHREACFACGACVRQCPESALALA